MFDEIGFFIKNKFNESEWPDQPDFQALIDAENKRRLGKIRVVCAIIAALSAIIKLIL